MSGSHCATSRMRCAADTAEPRRDAPRMMGAATSNMPMTASSRPASKGPDRPPPSCSPSPNHNTPSTARRRRPAGTRARAPRRRWAWRACAFCPHRRSKCARVRLRMQRHHVGVAVHRVQHSGAQAGRAFLRGGGSARGALQAPGRKHAGHQQRQREHQRGGRYPVAQHRRHDGAGQQRRGQRRQHEQEHSIQRVHVAGHARHQIAAAIARQLARRQADQRAEHQRAQIGQQAQRGRVLPPGGRHSATRCAGTTGRAPAPTARTG